MKRGIILFVILGISLTQGFAQCAMCRAVLESEESQTAAEGVNDGIIYLMSIPYLLVAAIGVILYFKFFRKAPIKGS